MFRVFRSEWYDKKLEKMDRSEIMRIEIFEQQLKNNPFSGKPLGYRFFREKKFDGKFNFSFLNKSGYWISVL